MQTFLWLKHSRLGLDCTSPTEPEDQATDCGSIKHRARNGGPVILAFLKSERGGLSSRAAGQATLSRFTPKKAGRGSCKLECCSQNHNLPVVAWVAICGQPICMQTALQYRTSRGYQRSWSPSFSFSEEKDQQLSDSSTII